MIELSPAPAKLPPGRRVYAIGDIHGCAEQLADLHRLIQEDLAARPIGSALLLHVGDYVDRGADTRGVIERLAERSPIPGTEMVNLMGNHENTMIEALSGERAAATDWLFHRWPRFAAKLRDRSGFVPRNLAVAHPGFTYDLFAPVETHAL